METVDCRGLKCPEPVIRTKNALERDSEAGLKIIVDNEVSRENVIRFAGSRGRKASYEREGDLFVISIDPPGSGEAEKAGPAPIEFVKADLTKTVLLFLNDSIGTASEELGRLLMGNFIYTLTQREDLPEAMAFMNAGVKLCIGGSPTEGDLRVLEAGGTRLLVCGTCLNYYGLTESLKAGAISNMYDIADLLMEAEKTLTL